MKNTTLLFILFIGLSTLSQAQINVGLKAGLNSLIDILSTDINGEPSESMKQKNQAFQLSIAYLLNVPPQ